MGFSAGRGHDRRPARRVPAALGARGRVPWRSRRCRSPTSARTSATSPAASRRDGDSWVINGNKYWCTFADGADYIMLVARTSDSPDPQAQACRPVARSWIEKPRGTLPPGVKGAPIPKIGYFGWKTWELAFDNCRLPAEAS